MSALLILLVVILASLVIFQIAKALELIGTLKKDEEDYEYSKNDRLAFLVSFVGFAVLAYTILSVFPEKHKFLPKSASEHGVWIDQTINLTLFFTGIVYVITQVLLFAFVVMYRKKKNVKALYLPHNNTVEIIWTVVPAIVLFVLIGFGLYNWARIFKPAPTEALIIEATGQQFRWTIRYPGPDNKLGPRDFTLVNMENELGINWNNGSSHDDFIADEIVLPIGKPVLVKIGSLDVLHNFYLPHFRLKMDAVPGIPTKFWFRPTITTAEMREIQKDPEFDYILACAELCGSAHYNMKKIVKIVSEEEYEAWKAEQKSYYETVVIPLQANN